MTTCRRMVRRSPSATTVNHQLNAIESRLIARATIRVAGLPMMRSDRSILRSRIEPSPGESPSAFQHRTDQFKCEGEGCDRNSRHEHRAHLAVDQIAPGIR